MESAVLGVIIDSSVAIEAERDHLDVAGFLKRIGGIPGERGGALCAVTVAELALGIYRASTPERRERRRRSADFWYQRIKNKVIRAGSIAAGLRRSRVVAGRRYFTGALPRDPACAACPVIP